MISKLQPELWAGAHLWFGPLPLACFLETRIAARGDPQMPRLDSIQGPSSPFTILHLKN